MIWKRTAARGAVPNPVLDELRPKNETSTEQSIPARPTTGFMALNHGTANHLAASPPPVPFQTPLAPDPSVWPGDLIAKSTQSQLKEKRSKSKLLSLSGTVELPPAHQREDSATEAAAAFGKIASVLMRNGETSQYKLADLSWLVAPAIEAGSYAVIDATNVETRTTTPAAIALWAFVSPAVDQHLCANIFEPVRLSPKEWTSGSIPWLVVAAGEPDALQQLMAHLTKTRLKGLTVKMRTQDPDGRAAIGVLKGTA